MQFLRLTGVAALGAAFAVGTVAAGATDSTMSNNDVMAALHVIQRDADRIAAGKYHGKSLQAPAHEIGVKWYRVEPTLAKNGVVIVETRIANASITAFDKTWRQNGKARSAAKDVSENVASLTTALKRNAQPAPSAAASPQASPSGTPAPAASAAPSPSAAPAASQKPARR
ncbi:MAG: hypothetical protein GIX03_03525 [Candidatus Eremiobacteraeota bacterium]|nr:hypothetical protein [Candidatus Eremiobacteraeota bacterium]MBC5802084.1 hypothetical protein [Candidatus Eremiobacteraeota bacterium]MBC5822807.1 hypothetical protein [Candidatus Eremiobacteraeota bacterium]